ncbi:uncharacterized protein P884DRAFT_248671 [Thermothelomyces heterothallicus CBS 202.75]|uniref:uncharacterized protein n=1 Tax=Thermothelomyces heterothallicus CBS 202.75 TaxID=1149848 RepID=UPI003743CE9F
MVSSTCALPVTLPIRTKRVVRTGKKGNTGSSKGRIIRLATVFHPQNDRLSPEAHFPVSRALRASGPRLVNRFNRCEMMLVIAGSCLRNGGDAPVGGCAFVFGGDDDDEDAGRDRDESQKTDGHAVGVEAVAFRLESRDADPPSSPEDTCNRAKLIAAIAALRFRDWAGEGWRRVVVVTDLEYLAKGATEWLPNWVRSNWRKPPGAKPGKKGGRDDERKCYLNRDLWEELQARIEELMAAGCEVSFWQVNGEEYDRNDQGVLARAKRAAQTAMRDS